MVEARQTGNGAGLAIRGPGGTVNTRGNAAMARGPARGAAVARIGAAAAAGRGRGAAANTRSNSTKASEARSNANNNLRGGAALATGRGTRGGRAGAAAGV